MPVSFVFEILPEVRRLVIRPGGIGDLIVSLPALESIRTEYFDVWTTARNVPLIRFAHRVRSIQSTGLDLLGVTDAPAGLLEELFGFDSIISWYGTNRPEFRDLVHSLGLPFRFFPALPARGSALHATDFYLDQMASFRTSATDGIPRIQCDVPRQRFAVIQPFSGSARKNWPLDNFFALAARLETVLPVHWCTGPEDPPLPGAVRIDDLYELACWLASASFYVGNDSGITHLAAAVGTPVLAWFGPTDPAVWAPRGPNVRTVTF